MSFRQFFQISEQHDLHTLEEAKTNPTDPATMDRAARVLEKFFRRRFGKLYRYGGSDWKEKFQDSFGKGFYFHYITGQKQAFRLRWYTTHNTGVPGLRVIDIWKKFRMPQDTVPPADFSMLLPPEFNIFTNIKRVSTLIKKPKVGRIEIAEQLLLEKRRTTMDEFAELAQQIIGRITNLSHADIRQISTTAGVTVPSSLTHPENKVGRGRFNIPVGDANTTKGTQSGEKAKKPDDLLIITRNQLGQFQNLGSAQRVQSAEKLYQNLQDRGYSVQELFKKLEVATEAVARGVRPSLLITGMAGTGKTYTVMQIVKRAGLRDGDKYGYIVVKGKSTPMSLYDTLFRNRYKLIIFDDTDSVWESGDAVNILKAALDSYDVRKLSWISRLTKNISAASAEEKERFIQQQEQKLDKTPDAVIELPSEFEFHGRIIFISNVPSHKLDKAIISRSMMIDISLTPDEMFERIRLIIDKVGNSSLSIDRKNDVLDILSDYKAKGRIRKEINMRTFVAACDLAASGLPDWEDILELV